MKAFKRSPCQPQLTFSSVGQGTKTKRDWFYSNQTFTSFRFIKHSVLFFTKQSVSFSNQCGFNCTQLILNLLFSHLKCLERYSQAFIVNLIFEFSMSRECLQQCTCKIALDRSPSVKSTPAMQCEGLLQQSITTTSSQMDKELKLVKVLTKGSCLEGCSRKPDHNMFTCSYNLPVCHCHQALHWII